MARREKNPFKIACKYNSTFFFSQSQPRNQMVSLDCACFCSAAAEYGKMILFNLYFYIKIVCILCFFYSFSLSLPSPRSPFATREKINSNLCSLQPRINAFRVGCLCLIELSLYGAGFSCLLGRLCAQCSRCIRN